jgi:hypothetical protein
MNQTLAHPHRKSFGAWGGLMKLYDLAGAKDDLRFSD